MPRGDKTRGTSAAGGKRRSSPPPRDEHLSGLSHELSGHVLTLRLLLGSLSSSASDGQRETLRLLGEVVEAQAVIAHQLSDLSRLPRGASKPGETRDG